MALSYEDVIKSSPFMIDGQDTLLLSRLLFGDFSEITGTKYLLFSCNNCGQIGTKACYFVFIGIFLDCVSFGVLHHHYRK